MKKISRVIIWVVCILFAVTVAIGIYDVTALREFYAVAEKEFRLPGTEDFRYDQQGLCFDEQSGMFLFSGYMRDFSPDPVYIVDPESGETVKTLRLYNTDGSPFIGHAGGLEVKGEYLYVAGSRDDCLYVFRRADLYVAEDEGKVTCIGIFPTKTGSADGVRVSFVSKDSDRIYVGEFHDVWLPFYWLRSNHKIAGENGTTYSLLVGFDFDENSEFGLSKTPSVVYALPSKIQHSLFSGDKLLLAESLLFVPSRILTTEPFLTGKYTIMGTEVPLYSLKIENSEYAIPMVEGFEEYNGRIYLSSELYNFIIPKIGELWDGDRCYSLAVSN